MNDNTENTQTETDGQVNWQEIYSDLGSRAAKALREARIRPEQLVGMSDGEITALPGIGDAALEEIRSKYPADIDATKEVEKTDEPKTSAAKPKKVSKDKLPANKRHLFRASKKYQSKMSEVDRTKLYTTEEAVSLLKNVNIASFNATVTLHINLKERLPRVDVKFPHSTGKLKKVEIATDALLKSIEEGNIDFDILVADPSMMPKLAKYAKVLGPRGLMPNPKTGTVTADTEAKKKELEGGKTMLKSEPKFPLMHVSIGKIEMKPEELYENIEAVIKAVKPHNIMKATLASSMSPGIKILIK